jgi:hypothetical protein
MRNPHNVAEQIKACAEMIELHLLKPSSSTRREKTIFMFLNGLCRLKVQFSLTLTQLFSLLIGWDLSIVIRNHMGLCVATCSDLLEEVTMPKIAEALVMREDLSLVDDEGFSKVMVVSIHLLFGPTSQFFFSGLKRCWSGRT